MKKRMLAAIFAALMATSMTIPSLAADITTGTGTTATETPTVTTYADVAATDWFYTAVSYVSEKELMDPAIVLTQAFFHPDFSITREEVAETIYRDAKLTSATLASDYAGNAAEEAKDYASVSTKYKEGVRFCFAAGIMTGNDNQMLKPKDAITREEFAAVLNRYTQLLSDKQLLTGIASGEGMSEKEFKDYSSISSWARANVAFCLKNKLMVGSTSGNFFPQGNITRAEMAQVIYNQFAKKAVPATDTIVIE